MTAAALLGLAAGPQAAMQYIENLGAEHHGSQSRDGKTVLRLPWPKDPQNKAYFEKRHGFIWGEKPDRRAGDLTVDVQVPTGWKVEGTDHWLWHRLVDPAGQHRASIMLHYQDRDADLYPVRKYSATTWQREYSDDEDVHPAIEDSNGNVLWMGEAIKANPNHQFEYATYWNEARKKAPPGGMTHEQFEAAKAGAPQSPRAAAGEIASARLQQYAPLNTGPVESYDIYFDKPVAYWGKDNVPVPELKTYVMSMSYYHGYKGGYADGGSEKLKAVDDAQAITTAEKRFGRGLGGYWRTGKLTLDGKEIWKATDPVPEPKFVHRRGAAYTEWDSPAYDD